MGIVAIIVIIVFVFAVMELCINWNHKAFREKTFWIISLAASLTLLLLQSFDVRIPDPSIWIINGLNAILNFTGK